MSWPCQPCALEGGTKREAHRDRACPALRRRSRTRRALAARARAHLAPHAALLSLLALVAACGGPQERVRDLPRPPEDNIAQTAYQLGVDALHVDNPAQAVIAFTWALDESPRWAEARLNRAVAWAVLGRLDQAESDLRVLRVTSPDDPVVAYHLAWVLREQGASRDALAVLDGVPGDDDALLDARRLLAALAWTDLAEPERARSELASVREGAPAEFACARARIEALEGDDGAAIRAYREALDVEPTHLVALRNLGAMLSEVDPREARELFDAFLDLAPEDDPDRPGVREARRRLR